MDIKKLSPIALVIVAIILYAGVGKGSMAITSALQAHLDHSACQQEAKANNLPPDCK